MLSMAAQLRANSPLDRWLHLAAATATGAALGLGLALLGSLFGDVSPGGERAGQVSASLVVVSLMLVVSKTWNTGMTGLPRWWWTSSPAIASWLTGMMVGLGLPVGSGRRSFIILGAVVVVEAEPLVGAVVLGTVAFATAAWTVRVATFPTVQSDMVGRRLSGIRLKKAALQTFLNARSWRKSCEYD